MKRPELPGNKAEKLITFIYYKDLQKGIDFYSKTLGFPMEIDQGWCKIFRISEAGYIGALAGSDDVQDVLFKQLGLIRVDDLDEMFETAELFSKLGARLPKWTSGRYFPSQPSQRIQNCITSCT